MKVLTPLLYPDDQSQKWLRYFLIALLLLGLVVSLMPATDLQSTLLTQDKLVHALAFFGFAFLLDRSTNKPFWTWQVLALLAYGLLIECLQFTLPWRSFSWWDWLADGVGIVFYGVLFRHWLKINPELTKH